ncbi:MAG TPA: TrmB family transcriptional regulator [Candidatus Bathyarchaeota archaeon]|nr:MAG: hypothetical protein DRZ80_03975 [Thermoprotei archaeon]HDN01666.1 TrmB family transcriptional regulator [Candidatus Bathyarchaeota archaeon]
MKELKERTIEKLMELGLSRNEAKAYIALIELGVSSPLDIAAASGIPVSKIYYVLSELEKKGIIEVHQSKPKLYRAIDLTRALDILIERYLEAKKDAMKLIEMLSARGRKANTKTLWIVRGRKNIINRIKYLIKNANESLIAASTDNILLLLAKNIRQAISRGVNVTLVSYKTRDEATNLIVKRFKQEAMLRIRYVIAPSVFIADDSIGIVYITRHLYRVPDKRIETALLVEDEEYLPIFSTYFRFFLWYPSKLVTPPEEFLSRPRTYRVYYRAVEDARYLLSIGIRLKAEVEGWLISGDKRKKVTLKGKVVNTYISSDKTIYNLTLVTNEGKKYLLGGKRCIIEDIETEKITLIPTT